MRPQGVQPVDSCLTAAAVEFFGCFGANTKWKVTIMQKNHYKSAIILLFALLVLSGPQGTASAQEAVLVDPGSNRIAVMPFLRGRINIDALEKVRLPLDAQLSQLVFEDENLMAGAENIVTEIFQRILEEKGNVQVQVLPFSQTKSVYSTLAPNKEMDTPRIIAKALGERLKTDLIVVGTVWRFRERGSGQRDSTRPASVAFTVYLVNVFTGKTLWNYTFDKTQQTLSENMLDAVEFFKQGARWLSAEKLAQYGAEVIVKEMNKRPK